MKKIFIFCCFIFIFASQAQGGSEKIRIAVEFVTHAASAQIAKAKGWYEEAGLEVETFDSYVNGMALASALSRDEVNAAYICLSPAINAYANAKVPLKIVTGLHWYGYSLVVNPKKIKKVEDLNSPKINIGVVKDGSGADGMFNMVVEKYNLDKSIYKRIKRMSPAHLLLALKNGQLDAVAMPEQFPSIAQEAGFEELVKAQDVWPKMGGSVLIVTQDLLEKDPDSVKKLVQVTKKGIEFIHSNQEESIKIVNKHLNVEGEKLYPSHLKNKGVAKDVLANEKSIENSLYHKLFNTHEIDPAMIQEAIDYQAKWGNIKKSFPASEILDLRFNDE
ncbi:MAG: ABC transporter substrate-binding protein [Sulfurospirillaceae bacterium]|nr:ABC transporter substrate-binding protein [Sulfurospirillaceae bacterium]